MVAIELEVLAGKYDRFGWDRDRGTAVRDRMITDWMDALQDYPLEEVQAACRARVVADPKNMPNEGAIVAEIMKARAAFVAARKRTAIPKEDPPRRMDADTLARRREFAESLVKGFAEGHRA